MSQEEKLTFLMDILAMTVRVVWVEAELQSTCFGFKKKNGQRFVVEKVRAEVKQVKVSLIKMATGQVSTGEKKGKRDLKTGSANNSVLRC